MADAFHQAAVAEEDVGAVVDDGVPGAVELARQHLLGEREADRVREALAERAGRRLDAGRRADLGMPWASGCAVGESAAVPTAAVRSPSGAAARRAASTRGRC